MKTSTFRFLWGAAAGLCLVAGAAWGACLGDDEVAGEWIFEPVSEMPGWAINSGTDGDMGNLGLTGGAAFSTNVPPVNCDCGHSLFLPGATGVAGAVSINDYDPLAGAEKFSILAWVRRDSADGANLSARIFSDADSTALTNTTSGVEFRFSGNAGNLALRINGTEVSSTVGGVAPTNGEWHHVAVVYDGTRAATSYATRNVHFYVDGIQRGVGSTLRNVTVATNYAPVVVGNASPSRTAANLMAGHIDDVLVIPGWAPDAPGNGNTSDAIQCFMNSGDDIFPPSIIAPADVEAEAGECLAPVAVSLGSASAWDDCGVMLVTNDAPTVFEVGFTDVTWSAVDMGGNVATATQTVTVVPSRTFDCDGDGLTDYVEEMELGTDSTRWDTDGDGWGDGAEVAMGFNPADATDRPKVMFNAALYNPAGTDTDKEWIEVYSASTRAVDLGGVRLQVGKETGWETVATFPVGTSLAPGRILLLGESLVTNADITALLDIPNAWTNEPTTGLRMVLGGTTNETVLDTVFIGGGTDFNESGLDETGWLSTNSVWAHAGTILERRFPGVDTDHTRDWHEMPARLPRNSSAIPDFDGDGLSDGDEWTGDANPWGEPMNPWNADSDGDGLGDYEECITYGTNPNTWATDGDIWPWVPEGTVVSNWPGSDSYELLNGWNPLAPDENTNGIPDSWEMAMGLANLDGLTDSDGDGIDDLTELQHNSDPADAEDSVSHPYVIHYEPSRPGWVNGGGANDIGIGGWVRVCVTGATPGAEDKVGVFVSEGNVLEEFELAWLGATEESHASYAGGALQVTTAVLDGNAELLVRDAALHPDYPNTPGGEYAITTVRVNLDIAGVAETQEISSGGFVPVNANNDNGSVLTDGIPATRDFATSGYVDNDLVALFLATEGGAGFGGEFRLSKLESGRSRIKVWDSIDKTNEIILPASWIAGTDQVPSTLWVEGLREGTRLRDAGLMLAYVHDGAIRSQDSVRLTVTPVLKTLSATPSNRQPGLVQDGSKFLAANDGLSALGDPAIQFLAEVENLPNNPRGSLRLIQHAWMDCLLENGFGFHGHSGVLCKIYLNEPMASEGLVDSDATEFPFYHSEGLSLCVASGIDTPELGVYYPDVWPWREGFVSQIDIRMRFRLSAVWQFLDGTIYFLGNTTWNTRFQGELARPGTNTVFNAGLDNKTIGSATFFVDNTDYRTSSPIANTCYAYQYQQP